MTGDVEDFADEFDLKYGKLELMNDGAQCAGFAKHNKRCKNRGHHEFDGAFYCGKHLPKRDAA